MNDLIRKSALVDALTEQAKNMAEVAANSAGQAVDYYSGMKTGFASAAIMANSAPTIEPKRGKWMAIGNTGLAACECGYITNRYSIYNYCPNCGAKMSGEIKDGE